MTKERDFQQSLRAFKLRRDFINFQKLLLPPKDWLALFSQDLSSSVSEMIYAQSLKPKEEASQRGAE